MPNLNEVSGETSQSQGAARLQAPAKDGASNALAEGASPHPTYTIILTRIFGLESCDKVKHTSSRCSHCGYVGATCAECKKAR